MSKINFGRVVLGGLVAGLILTSGDVLVNGVLLADEWNAALKAIDKDEIGGVVVGLLVATDFIAGIYLVWLYAAILPRFGKGPGTAVLAGFSTWFLASFLHALAEGPTGIYPVRLYAASVGTMFVVVPLAAVAGAWLYREEGPDTIKP